MSLQSLLFKVFCIVSAVLAAIAIILSGVYLAKVAQVEKDSYKEVMTKCEKMLGVVEDKWCKEQRLRLAGVSIGIFVAIIQFIYALVSLIAKFDHHNCYPTGHIIFAIFLCVAFLCLAIADRDLREQDIGGIKVKVESDESKISICTVIILGVDCLFCVISAILICLLGCSGGGDG